MKKVIHVELPQQESKLRVHDLIIKTLGDKAMTSWQIHKKSRHNSASNLRALLANMVRDDLLECVKCPHCDIGKMYKVK